MQKVFMGDLGLSSDMGLGAFMSNLVWCVINVSCSAFIPAGVA